MRPKRFATFGGVVMASALFATSPAVAYDPCARAYQQEREAEDAFWRWCDNHYENGSCGVQGRGAVLYNEYQAAIRNRQRACA